MIAAEYAQYKVSAYAEAGLTGHTFRCVGYSEEQALENGAVSDSEAVEWAGIYLHDGTTDCVCDY